jgi:copper chaperone CopZ
MTHTYEVKGMSCSGCVENVQKALNNHPDVISAEVTLSPPRATIHMKKHVGTSDLQEYVSKAGRYTILEQK